jgi:tetratricopeptide (TPR) repeat protein
MIKMEGENERESLDEMLKKVLISDVPGLSEIDAWTVPVEEICNNKLALEWYEKSEKAEELGRKTACYEMAISFDPDCSFFYFKLANVLHTAKEYDRALQYYQKLLEFKLPDKNLSQVYSSIAGIFAAKGQHDEAIKSVEKAVEFYPGNSGTYYFRLGSVFLKRQDYSKSAEYFSKSINHSRFPTSTLGILWALLAAAHYRGGDHEKAALCFEKSLELHPSNWKVHLILSRIYDQKGDKELAGQYSKNAEHLRAEENG